MIHVLARITVLPNAADKARAILQELVVQSRREPGCLAYELYQQSRQPHVFQTVERWQDQAAADAHLLSPHVAAVFVVAMPLLAAEPEIEAYVLASG